MTNQTKKHQLISLIVLDLHFSDKNLDFVLKRLEQQSSIALKWFEESYMKMNSGKCHLLFQIINVSI